MAEKFSFFDPAETEPGIYDREYNAQEFTNYFEGLIETGLMKEQGEELKVTTTGENMDSVIGEGIAYIAGRHYENDSPLNHTHDTESIGVNRIDRIVVRLDLNTDARHVKSFIKKGLASVSPNPPALERTELNNKALVYEISLAQVLIVGGQTFIDSDAITDERGTPAVCPWATSRILPNYDDSTLQGVLDQVTAAVDGIDTHEKNNVIHIYYANSSGVANARTVNLNPAVQSYVDGLALSFKSNTVNTGPPTINVNSLGAKQLVDVKGYPLKPGALTINGIYTVRYNATTGNFILQGEGGGLDPNIYSNVFFAEMRQTISSDANDTHGAVTYEAGTFSNSSIVNLKTKEAIQSASSNSRNLAVSAVYDGFVFWSNTVNTRRYSNDGTKKAESADELLDMAVDASENDTLYLLTRTGLKRNSNMLINQAINPDIVATHICKHTKSFLYVINSNTKTLYKINKTTLEVIAQATLSGFDTIENISSDGAALYINGTTASHSRFEKRNNATLSLIKSNEFGRTNNSKYDNGVYCVDGYVISGLGYFLDADELTPSDIGVALTGRLVERLIVGYKDKVTYTSRQETAYTASEAFIIEN